MRGEQRQYPAPTALRLERAAHGLGRLAETLELAMLQLDARQRRTEHDEAHLHLGGEIRIVLPVRADLPGEHDAAGRIPHQHLAPLAFAAVGGALEPAPAGARLDDRGLGILLADVVGRARPPRAVLLGEGAERARLTGFDGDLLAHGRHGRPPTDWVSRCGFSGWRVPSATAGRDNRAPRRCAPARPDRDGAYRATRGL